MKTIRRHHLGGGDGRPVYELRRRANGIWGVVRDGTYLASTGKRDEASALRLMNLLALQLGAGDLKSFARFRRERGPH
ncbi:hypothetical protein [Bradyrhizobium yuanmingense]|uniref:hypothetical protein n=1 Tax=Bradyrhizobium yuanmingense TaxID=108015 RepID=UPI001CD78FC7|nr:hypothetical protein [Bradyrhizobium yuanmingense]MCA1529460.1 hypothetical protein [Bradyrhizobium yuanmingense]